MPVHFSWMCVMTACVRAWIRPSECRFQPSMSFIPWVIPNSPAGFINSEYKRTPFRAKMLATISTQTTSCAIVVHLTHSIFAQNHTSVCRQDDSLSLWVAKNKKYFETLLTPLQGSEYECLLLCGVWCEGNNNSNHDRNASSTASSSSFTEGFVLSHIQMGNDKSGFVLADPSISSQMLQLTPAGLSIAPWISQDIILEDVSQVSSLSTDVLVRDMRARDSHFAARVQNGAKISLQPTENGTGDGSGTISCHMFAACCVQIDVLPAVSAAALTEILPSSFPANSSESKNASNGTNNERTDGKMLGTSMSDNEVDEKNDEESFTPEETSAILAQYLTPEVLEQIPVMPRDEAGIYFVQYVCDFVKEDLWAQRRMSESLWIGVVKALKRELYAYLDRRTASIH